VAAATVDQAPVAEPSTVILPAPLLLTSLPPLTAERWERSAPLLPPQRPPTGRPATNHRQILAGMLWVMLWVMHAGTSWRQMPSRYGPWHTIYGRFQRWTREGLWAQIRAILLTSSHLSL
jgi:transposase